VNKRLILVPWLLSEEDTNTEPVMIEVRRYAYIDALRGWAILGVIAVHCCQWVAPSSPWLKSLVSDGARGVQLFFVVSALTLFLSINTRLSTESFPARNFFIRRVFRIAPMFWLGLVMSLAFNGLASRYWTPNGLTLFDVALTALFLHGWHPETINSVVPGGWSIAVEMTFYLFVPFLYGMICNVRRALLFTLFSIGVGAWLNPHAAQYWLPYYPVEQHYLAYEFSVLWIASQLPLFAMGICVARIIERHKPPPNVAASHAILALSLMLLAVALTTTVIGPVFARHHLFGLSFSLLALALWGAPVKIFVNGLIIFAGKISFSLYIVHFLVLEMIRIQILWRPALESPSDGSYLLAYPFLLVTSVVLSSLTYFVIERGGIKAGNHLIQWLETRDGFTASEKTGTVHARGTHESHARGHQQAKMN
jgi:peptidoglycan/LPS O-acetylase OafA/YrhL